jgi:hypothetical protein
VTAVFYLIGLPVSGAKPPIAGLLDHLRGRGHLTRRAPA